MTNSHKSLFRIFIVLMFSAMASGAVVGFMIFAYASVSEGMLTQPLQSIFLVSLMGVGGIFMGGLFAPFLVFPVLLVLAYPLCVILDRTSRTNKYGFMAGGALIATLYWFIIDGAAGYLDEWFYCPLFALSGLLTGLFYWREMYSDNLGSWCLF